ncbi:MAG: hypothetical protein J2P22_02345 [Nocardioides sp.]|nr:hypothetical protein [Nocardioides sp.]
MHSLHVTVTIKHEVPDQAAHLAEVVSYVSAKPGFVHGYWLAPMNGQGHAYTFFDTEENARASAPLIGMEHADGAVEISGVELCPVAATA